jgi:phenylalanine-4-hydroxylase
MREENSVTEEKVMQIFNQLKMNFSKDWLLFLELYELALKNNFSVKSAILSILKDLKSNESYTKLIENGLNLY